MEHLDYTRNAYEAIIDALTDVTLSDFNSSKDKKFYMSSKTLRNILDNAFEIGDDEKELKRYTGLLARLVKISKAMLVQSESLGKSAEMSVLIGAIQDVLDNSAKALESLKKE